MFNLFSKKKKVEERKPDESIVYRDMKLLSESAIGFVELRADEDIYQYIGKSLQKMVGSCVVFINEYIEEKKSTRLIDMFGLDEASKKRTLKALNFDLYKTLFPMSKEERENLVKKSLVYVEDGIYSLSSKKIPKYFAKGIEKMFKVTDVYIMGFSWEGKIYGNAVVLLRNNEQLRREAIEAFLHQAAVSLRRRDADKKLQETLDSLEEKVKERTKDLQQTASELEKFKLAVENTSDQVVITDLDGKIQYVNNAATKITGYNKGEIIGKKPRLWGNELPNEYYKKIFDGILSSKKTYHGELNNRKKDGQEYIADLRIDPVLDPRGDVIFFVGIERDITHEKKVDQAKTEFVSLASHQLRTPLSAINWYVELVMDDKVKLTQKQRDYLHEIYTASKRMGDLVGSLLNVSRIELGTFTVMPQKINLEKISEDVFKELVPKINEKKHQIKKSYPKDSSYKGDGKLTRIIFHNLLSNAIKYTPAGGKINLNIKKDKNWYKIEVSDNGYGIPKEQQQQMFTKLFRADNVREKISEGTGLGMYLVKSIIDEVEGKISFKSEKNKGTEFIIKLPLSGMKKKEGTKELS